MPLPERAMVEIPLLPKAAKCSIKMHYLKEVRYLTFFNAFSRSRSMPRLYRIIRTEPSSIAVFAEKL